MDTIANVVLSRTLTSCSILFRQQVGKPVASIIKRVKGVPAPSETPIKTPAEEGLDTIHDEGPGLPPTPEHTQMRLVTVFIEGPAPTATPEHNKMRLKTMHDKGPAPTPAAE